jgi:hypothetical protein
MSFMALDPVLAFPKYLLMAACGDRTAERMLCLEVSRTSEGFPSLASITRPATPVDTLAIDIPNATAVRVIAVLESFVGSVRKF